MRFHEHFLHWYMALQFIYANLVVWESVLMVRKCRAITWKYLWMTDLRCSLIITILFDFALGAIVWQRGLEVEFYFVLWIFLKASCLTDDLASGLGKYAGSAVQKYWRGDENLFFICKLIELYMDLTESNINVLARLLNKLVQLSFRRGMSNIIDHFDDMPNDNFLFGER